MVNTGYVCVDCSGINVLQGDGVRVVHAGIFEKVKAAYETGKPALACNMEYGSGVPLTPVPVFMIEEGGAYIASASILQLVIDPTDGVTVNNLITMAANRSATKSAKK